MNRTCLLPAAAALLVMSAGAASAQNGLYVTGSLGALMSQDISYNTTFRNALGQSSPGTNTQGFDPGVSAGLGVGYRLPLNLRVEGELGYGSFETTSATPRATGGAFPQLNGRRLDATSAGDNTLFTATAALYYDLPLGGPVVPYIGAGGGYYHLDMGQARYWTGAGTLTRLRGTQDNGLAMAELGVTWNVSEHWAVAPAYRYEHLFASAPADFDLHIFKLSGRYSF